MNTFHMGLGQDKSFMVVRATLAEANVSVEEVALQMGELTRKQMEPARLKNWMDSPGKRPGKSSSSAMKKAYSKRIDPLCRIDRFIQHTGDVSLLDWLAARRGGIFIQSVGKGISGEQRQISLIGDWYQTWSEIHALRSVIKEAFEDDRKFDVSEADRIAFRWFQVRRWIEGVTLRWVNQFPDSGSVSCSVDADRVMELPSWAMFGQSMECLAGREGKNSDLGEVHLEKSAAAIKKDNRRRISMSQEALAQHIGLSRESARNWWKKPDSEDRKSSHPNPLDECLALMESTRSNRPLEWLAARYHGCVVPGCRRKEIRDVFQDWMKTHLEWSELECALGRYVIGQKKAGKGDLLKLRKEWEDVKECMPTLIAAIYQDAVRSGQG